MRRTWRWCVHRTLLFLSRRPLGIHGDRHGFFWWSNWCCAQRSINAWELRAHGISDRHPGTLAVLGSEWRGNVLGSVGTVTLVLRGPEVKIRRPKWTEKNPREDLPLIIFTIAAWNEHPT